jgi:hypothetical protein
MLPSDLDECCEITRWKSARGLDHIDSEDISQILTYVNADIMALLLAGERP